MYMIEYVAEVWMKHYHRPQHSLSKKKKMLSERSQDIYSLWSQMSAPFDCYKNRSVIGG